MARLETIEINRNGTRVIINKSDFVEGEHKLWATSQEPNAKESEPKQDDSLVDQYKELYGKKPHHLMKPENIQAAIDKKLED